MASRGILLRTLPTFFKTTQTACISNHKYIIYKPSTQLRRIVPLLHQQQRMYSIDTSKHVIVDYDYVQDATKNDNILIIDVRDHSEVQELGQIPSSIHIPVAEVSNVLSTVSDKEFEQTYKKPKPSKDSEVIFYCKIGRRSGMATQAALDLGYTNVKNYLGSWTDWASRKATQG